MNFYRFSCLRMTTQAALSKRSTTSLLLRFKSTSSSTGAAAASETTTSSSVPVAKDLGAAFLGVGTVTLAAAIVEMATAASVPPYDPKSQRFDQSNFVGRFSRMLLACDPSLLIYSKKQVQQAKDIIDNYQDYSKDMDDHALWEARRVVDAALHPDTAEWIPKPFRMSGYVPFNGPICVAMVASQSTLPLLFWSWVNQSQNALVNYYNRNASCPMTNETLVKSYSAAVGSALLVAFGLATAIQKRFPPQKAKSLLRYVAFPSAVVASTLNCYIVRSPEIETGVPLLNKDSQDVLPGSTSQEAAKRGVYTTTASRAALQAPVYFVPPVLMAVIGPLRRYLVRQPAMTVPVTTYLLLTSFGVGLPVTIAYFPQISSIPAQDVEDRFQHLRDPQTNQPYQVYYYNKGL